MPSAICDRLGERDRREAEHFGDLLGHGAGVAVGRLGAGDDQVDVAGLADGRGEHLGGGERIGARERGVADEHGLGGAHRERGAQAGRLVVRCHRDEADVATASGGDELQRHLDAVAVGLVEDQLAVTLERVGGGIQLAGECRIGNLLDTDDHVHKASKLPGGPDGSQSAERRVGVTRGWAPTSEARYRPKP